MYAEMEDEGEDAIGAKEEEEEKFEWAEEPRREVASTTGERLTSKHSRGVRRYEASKKRKNTGQVTFPLVTVAPRP